MNGVAIRSLSGNWITALLFMKYCNYLALNVASFSQPSPYSDVRIALQYRHSQQILIEIQNEDNW